MSREEQIAQTARDVQSKVPDAYDAQALRGQYGTPSPLQIVLLQEVDRWNILVKKMKVSLIDLQRALVGEIGMSDDLDALGEACFNGFLPAMWAKLAPASEKSLGNWMTHFEGRYEQYTGWIDEGDPACCWLSGLHVPDAFNAALVQVTCRLKNWPLDKSTLYTKVSRMTDRAEVTEDARLEYGCYIVGLYLEGAAWDHENSRLQRQKPKVSVVELPILQVIPVEASRLKLKGTFKTPVYVTQARRNAMGVGLVFEADLSSDEHASLWVLQGVALVLNTDS